MAVCGCCWLCGEKFECVDIRSCGDCTTFRPLRVERPVNMWLGKICGRCENDVLSGAVASLLAALRAQR